MANNNNYGGYDSQASTPPVQTGFTTSVLALSVVVSLLIGLIGGFFIGESRAEKNYDKLANAGYYQANTNTGNGSGDSSNGSGETSIYDSIDYSTAKINDSLTIDQYYSDSESKYYAYQLIGTQLPEMKWTDSSGVQHSTKELSSGRYILELFSSSCTYCNNSIEHVDAYRENTGNKIISLSLDDGDLSNFNKSGEVAWMLDNESDTAVSNVLQYSPWIPCFMVIEDNVIKTVDWGGVVESDIANYWNIAFGG